MYVTVHILLYFYLFIYFFYQDLFFRNTKAEAVSNGLNIRSSGSGGRTLGGRCEWECCRGGVLDVIGSALTSRVIVIGIDGWLSGRQRATRPVQSGRGLALGCYFQL